jgi:hypothetical protein
VHHHKPHISLLPVFPRMQRLIEDLTLLSAECKRGLPAVKDLADRALHARATATPSSDLSPFLLACNHPEAPRRLLSIALAAMQRLVGLDLLSLSDMASIVKVLQIQVRHCSQPPPTLCGHATRSARR